MLVFATSSHQRRWSRFNSKLNLEHFRVPESSERAGCRWRQQGSADEGLGAPACSVRGSGSMAAWLAARRVDVGCTRLFVGNPLPRADCIDGLIALGGPMSVNDEDELDWLRPEKQLVRDAVARGIPVLGVCLGDQLIASPLGVRVYAGAAKGIGRYPVHGTPNQHARGLLAIGLSGVPLARRDVQPAGCPRAPAAGTRRSRSGAAPAPCSYTSKRRLPAWRGGPRIADTRWCRGHTCRPRASCAPPRRRATAPSTG